MEVGEKIKRLPFRNCVPTENEPINMQKEREDSLP